MLKPKKKSKHKEPAAINSNRSKKVLQKDLRVKIKSLKKAKKFRNFYKNEDNGDESSFFYEEIIEDSGSFSEEIREELEDCLTFRPDFQVIELGNKWAILARIVNLSIRVVLNQSGFQPNERVVDSKKCILCLVEYGGEPERGHFGYALKRKGCPVIKLISKYNINERLNEV